jgi:glycerophosphoryl diester phosphodiesterase
MHKALFAAGFAAALVVSAQLAIADHHDDGDDDRDDERENIQVGPRPFYLVDGMDNSALKSQLLSCKDEPVHRTNFSIGHRGAALQFPEHTKESYQAAARMGAGIVECDVTFTGDGTPPCPERPGDDNQYPADAARLRVHQAVHPGDLRRRRHMLTPASAECRTSELTVQEFKSLRGKMDSFNPAARTPQEFQGGVPSWRTEVNTGRGLNERNGVKHTPELKEGDPAVIARVFGGQAQYAQRFADELRDAGVDPKDAFSQSFNVNDILYWINHTHYGQQATFLVDYDDVANNILLFDTTGRQLVSRAEQLAFFRQLRRAGVQIVAPAMPALLGVNGNRVVPSQLAMDLKGMGYDIITWTFERADLRGGASTAGFYYDFDPAGAAIKKDSDMYKALDVLARQVGILGIFSDWPATVSYYASCMGLK